MEPISAVVGVASFLGDVVDLGYKLKRSIEKVKRNKKKLRKLAEDINHDLGELQALYDRSQDNFAGSEDLLLAVNGLRSEMWRVCNKCYSIADCDEKQRGTFKAFGASLRAWNSRDLIEADIQDIKERIRDCYQKFMALSSIRIENAVLVQRAENNLMFRKLQLAANQMLLSTDYGQAIVRRIETDIMIPSDHLSIERQYFTLQISRLVESVTDSFPPDYKSPSLAEDDSFNLSFRTFEIAKSPLSYLINDIFELSRSVSKFEAVEVADSLAHIYGGMSHYYVFQEELAIVTTNVALYCIFARHNPQTMPHWALWLINLSRTQYHLGQYDAAVRSASDALAVLRTFQMSFAEKTGALIPTIALGQFWLAHSLLRIGRPSHAKYHMEEAVDDFRMALQAILTDRDPLPPGSIAAKNDFVPNFDIQTVRNALWAITSLSSMLEEESPFDAFTLAKEALCVTKSLSKSGLACLGLDQAQRLYFCTISSLSKAYHWNSDTTLCLASDAITLFRNLIEAHPFVYAAGFLRLLYAYIFLQHSIRTNNSREATLSEKHNEMLRSILYDGVSVNDGSMEFSPFVTFCFEETLFCGLDSMSSLVQDITFAACYLSESILNSMNPVVQDGLCFCIVSVANTFPEEVTKYAMEFSRSHPDVALLSSILFNRMFLPITLLRTVVNFLGKGEPSEHLCESSVTPNYPHGQIAVICSRAGLYHAALQLLEQTASPDLPLLAVVQDAMGRTDEAINSLSLFIAKNPRDRENARLSLADFLCRRRRFHEALRLAQEQRIDSKDDDLDVIGQSIRKAIAYLGLGEVDSARTICEDAIRQSRTVLAEQWSLGHYFQLAYGLCILSKCLKSGGHLEAAYGCANEAALLYRNYNVSDELHFYATRRDRAEVFHNLAVTLLDLKQSDQALEAIKFAIMLYEGLVRDCPGYKPELAGSLESLARIYWVSSRKSEALDAQNRASEQWRDVALGDGFYSDCAATSLDRLAYFLEKGGNSEEAAKVKRQRSLWAANISKDDNKSDQKTLWDPLHGGMDCSGPYLNQDGAKPNAENGEIETSATGTLQTLISSPTSDPVIDLEESSPQSAVVMAPSSSSVISYALGWFDKAVEQSANLQIDSLAVL